MPWTRIGRGSIHRSSGKRARSEQSIGSLAAIGPEVAKNQQTEADYPAVLTGYDVLDDLDRELRSWSMSNIERAEIALRTGQAGDRLVQPNVRLRRQKLPSGPLRHRQNPLQRLRCRPRLKAPQPRRLAAISRQSHWLQLHSLRNCVAKLEATPWHKAFGPALSAFPHKNR